MVSQLLGVRKTIECPHCKSEMKRIKREKWHRLVSSIKPVVRMRCCDEEHLVERSIYKMRQRQGKTDALLSDESGMGSLR